MEADADPDARDGLMLIQVLHRLNLGRLAIEKSADGNAAQCYFLHQMQ